MSIAVGLDKGYRLEKRELPQKPSNRHRLSNSKKMVRQLIREVAGFTPYERRMLELLRVNKDKRALKLAKARLGTHGRAKRKREEMAQTLRDLNRAMAEAARAQKKANEEAKE